MVFGICILCMKVRGHLNKWKQFEQYELISTNAPTLALYAA